MAEQTDSWLRFSSPKHFYRLVERLLPWLGIVGICSLFAGLYVSFVVAPEDYQQGNSYRIMFLHVPAAWMSMLLYLLMALYALIYLVWRVRLADVMARALAPTGILFTLIALWSGALWGKPTWGTYWVWDARITTELILLFLYAGYLALRHAIDDPRKAAQAASLLALVGSINVPIIYFSVQWWNTLHQGASISLTSAPSMAATMLLGLLLMTLACWIYAIMAVLYRAQNLLLEAESNAHWVREQIEQERRRGNA